jgi:beta-glucanase (GH16 family)
MGTNTDTNLWPLADQGQWTQVFYDGFNDGALDRWSWPIVYGGSQYWNKAFWWDQRDVVESDANNELVVSATKRGNTWTAGGTTTMRWDLSREDGFDFQYGRVEIRAAIDAGKGTGPAMLLWPFDNSWPPEIDMVETPNGQRKSVWFTNHWPGPKGEDQYHSVEIKSVDSTPFDALGAAYEGRKWYVYTLDWLPGKLVYYITDEVRQATWKVYETPPGEPVSAMPMSLALQMFVAANNDSWYGGGPDRTTPRTVNLHVDYVKVYESDATWSSGDRTATNQVTTAEGDLLSVQSETTEQDSRVRGGPRDEVLVGGPGPDLFIPGGGRDRVPDFVPGLDKLQLSGAPEQIRTFVTTLDGAEGLMVLYDAGPNTVFLPGAQTRGLTPDDIFLG